jgi:hypothetical protein
MEESPMSDNQCPIPCFACGKTLYEVGTQEAINQPHDALAFTTQGHYGTKVFDPMDGSWLELNICDGCITERQDRVLIGKLYAPRPQPLPKPKYKAWEGEEAFR